jgi:hypothetical protein
LFVPIFPLVNASSSVKALIGGNPVRFYQFGQNDKQPVVYPYAVWQRIYGVPLNYMGQVPDTDDMTIQIDCYESSSNVNGADKVRQIAAAIRDAIEQPQAAYITSWLGESRDPDTNSYRFGFQVEFFVAR